MAGAVTDCLRHFPTRLGHLGVVIALASYVQCAFVRNLSAAMQAVLARALVCWAILNASSAFAAGPIRKPVRSLLEIRQEGVIVQKWETSCAAAALATVLTYSHNDHVSEKLVAQAMLRSADPIKVKVRGGFSLLDMKRFVETRGFKGAAFKGLSIEDLLALQSPIVPIDFHGNPHFVVVRGINAAGEVHLADPAFGNHAMSKEAFQAIWREGIGFVVTR